MTPEMQTISDILRLGAASAMTLTDIIQQEINDWRASQRRKQMLIGQRYYEMDNDILKHRRTAIGKGGAQVEAVNLANSKLPHGFVRKLVDQKVGYLLSKSLSIQTENETYSGLLGEFFSKSFLRILQSIGRESINKGIAWLHPHYTPDGKLAFKRIPSEECIPLWKDAAHTELDAMIRVFEVEGYEGKIKKTVTKVEFWDLSGVQRLVITGSLLLPDVEFSEHSAHLSVISTTDTESETGLNWERVPFIAFKYHEDELPLVKFVQPLVDDYDRKKSDNANNLEDLPNSIYVLKGYDGTDLGEFRKNLTTFRAVKVNGDDNSGVDTLNLEINTEAYKTHQEQNRKDIFEFGRGVDSQSDKFGNDPSGVALKFLYQDLDLDANDIETEFQASLEQLRWFIDTHLANSGFGDYSNESVDFIFNRDMLINESAIITDIKNSVGVISDETLVAQHPYVTDVDEELGRIKKQKESDTAGYGGFGKDDKPPGADGA